MPSRKKFRSKKTAGIAQLQKKKDPKIDYYWDRVRGYGETYAEFHWPSLEVILSLAYAYDVLRAKISKFLVHYDLSLASFNILMILATGRAHGCKQREISQLLLVSRANVTGLVDSMQRRGLVKRTVDKADRRVFRVTITPQGSALLKSFLPEHYRRINRIVSPLDGSEKKKLSGMLEKIRNQATLERP